MPRLANTLPKYRRHKQSGQAVVTLGGRDCYLGPWKSVTSKAEYDRVIREWLVGGRAFTTCELTVVELLAAFVRHAKTYYLGPDGQPTSELASYRTLIQRLKTQYGRTPAIEFGP